MVFQLEAGWVPAPVYTRLVCSLVAVRNARKNAMADYADWVLCSSIEVQTELQEKQTLVLPSVITSSKWEYNVTSFIAKRYVLVVNSSYMFQH